MNRAARVLAFLEQYPDVWIEAVRFEPVGGRQAWRTAISEARTLAKARGMDILNRQRKHTTIHMGQKRRWTCSEYLLVSQPEPAKSWDAVFAGAERP